MIVTQDILQFEAICDYDIHRMELLFYTRSEVIMTILIMIMMKQRLIIHLHNYTIVQNNFVAIVLHMHTGNN